MLLSSRENARSICPYRRTVCLAPGSYRGVYGVGIQTGIPGRHRSDGSILETVDGIGVACSSYMDGRTHTNVIGRC